MFTGLIQELGTVIRVQRSKGLIRLGLEAPKTAARVQRLDSVAVNGVCLSVVGCDERTMAFEVIQETARLTTLSTVRCGNRVNLELSLGMSDRLGGQILFGHVDGVGTIVQRRERPGGVALTVRLASSMRKFVVPKGPIAVDGVSLTVGEVLTSATFAVHLIPETLRQTTLRFLAVRDRVNLEVDYLAKLVWQFTRRQDRVAGGPH